MRRVLAAVALAVALTGCGAAAPPSTGPLIGPPLDMTNTAPVAAAAPARISVPAIAASSTLIPTGIGPDGALEVPDVATPEQASWWSGSPEPGTIGPAVILGHVDGAGRPGVFARLADLVPGDEIVIDRVDAAPVRFVVEAVETVPKADFELPGSGVTRRVYGDTPGPELRLITCGGQFDTAADSYRDQVIAYARLAWP